MSEENFEEYGENYSQEYGEEYGEKHHEEDNEECNKEYDDKPAFRIKLEDIPAVTIGLILINVIVHLVLEYLGNTEEPLYMLRHGAALGQLIFDEDEYYRLFTSMFMHFGIGHLLNNMLALAIMGSTLERIIGRVYFSLVYMFSGIAGGFVSAMIHYNSEKFTICAGASGAIYGILGAIMIFTVLSIKERDKSVYIRIVLVLLLMLEGGTDSVDMAAHIGGFIAGIISMCVIFLWVRYQNKKKMKDNC